jgi:DNA-binding NtrC family response regulator
MSIKVLLVDDETGFVEALARRLALRRFDVKTASSAEQALQILDGEQIDVAVVDVKMPDVDGIEATRAFRARHPQLEVILLTGHASIEASQEGLTMGAFDYLLKPVSIDELVYKIEDAHRSRQLREEPSSEDSSTSGSS